MPPPGPSLLPAAQRRRRAVAACARHALFIFALGGVSFFLGTAAVPFAALARPSHPHDVSAGSNPGGIAAADPERETSEEETIAARPDPRSVVALSESNASGASFTSDADADRSVAEEEGEAGDTLDWDWSSLVSETLAPWSDPDGPGITREQLDMAALALKAVTPRLESEWDKTPTDPTIPIVPFVRYLPISWRAQIVDGKMYLEDIAAVRPQRTTVMCTKLTLLETLATYPGQIPDVDLVFSQWDNPVVSRHRERTRGKGESFWSSGDDRWINLGPPPVFSPSTGRDWLDLPFPDFTFNYPSKSRYGTDNWDKASRKILAAARMPHNAWENKISRAMFSGNCNQPATSPRPRLLKVAEAHPDLVFVNKIVAGSEESKRSCVNDVFREEDALKFNTRGVLVDRCSFKMEDVCRYKYLINVSPGGSYAGRLKYLFLCGSVVLHVKYAGNVREFYEHGLEPEVHFVSVDNVEDIPAAVEALNADPAKARRIAEAGRARMSRMGQDAVRRYVRDMLVGYAALQRFVPKVGPKSVRIACEDDLHRRYGREDFVGEDNSTCAGGMVGDDTSVGPGFGGAFDGTNVPCELEGPPEDWEMWCPKKKGIVSVGNSK